MKWNYCNFKHILLIMALCITCTVAAQEHKAKVTLKNGSCIIGEIKNFNPTKSITILVAGTPVEILMTDVEKVEQPEGEGTSAGTVSEDGEQYLVTDNTPYPDSITVDIGTQKVQMTLIRGGEFMMGYNGRHSLEMKSEPVHKVKITSFYISKNYINNAVWKDMVGLTFFKKSLLKPAYASWNEVETLINAIQQNTDKTFRLPTEAEWEYAACSSKQSTVFKDKLVEWCSDYYGKYSNKGTQTDPTGPVDGKSRVVRKYSTSDRYKFNRNYNDPIYGTNIVTTNFFHLVIKAIDIIK